MNNFLLRKQKLILFLFLVFVLVMSLVLFVGKPIGVSSIIKSQQERTSRSDFLQVPLSYLSATLSVPLCSERVRSQIFESQEAHNAAISGFKILAARIRKELKLDPQNGLKNLASKSLALRVSPNQSNQSCLIPLKIKIAKELAEDPSGLFSIALGSQEIFCKKSKAYLSPDNLKNIYPVYSTLKVLANKIKNEKLIAELNEKITRAKRSKKSDKEIKVYLLAQQYAKFIIANSSALGKYFDQICSLQDNKLNDGDELEPPATALPDKTLPPTIATTITTAPTVTAIATNTNLSSVTTPTATAVVTATVAATNTAVANVAPNKPIIKSPLIDPASGSLSLPAGTSSITINWTPVLNSSNQKRYLIRAINTANNLSILPNSIDPDNYASESITIFNLQSGSYRFWVHAANNNYPAANSYSVPNDLFFKIEVAGTPTPLSTAKTTATFTPTRIATPTQIATASNTVVAATATPLPSATQTKTTTAAPTHTATNAPTPSRTPSPVATATFTPNPTQTATTTRTVTAISVPSIAAQPSAPSITSPQSPDLPAGTSQVSIEWRQVLNSSGQERYLVRGINLLNNTNIIDTSINRDEYRNRSITITGLSAGNYRFWVHAANENYPAANSYSTPQTDFYFNIPKSSSVTPTLGTALKIMPLGDSITQGTDTRNATPRGLGGGYRLPLGNLLSGAGISYDFVGDSKLNSVASADPDHNGYPGKRTDEILSMLPTLLSNNSPDVILLHIGTNDILQGKAVISAAGNLEKIIQVLKASAPNRRIYLAKIIPFVASQYVTTSQASTWNAIVETYNQEVQRLAIQYNLNLVDMNAPGINGNTSKSIMTAEANDGIHPGDQGNAEIARRWYNALYTIGSPSPTPTVNTPEATSTTGTGTRIKIGAAEKIMDSFDSNGPTYDLSAPTLRKSATEFYTWWQNGNHSFKKFEGTLSNPFDKQLWQVSGSNNSYWNSNGFPKEPKAGERDYAHRPWMGNIYKHTDSLGTILIGLVHIETDIYNLTTCRYRQGLASSVDNGVSWKYLGDVIKPKFEQSDKFSNLAGAPLLIVGDYLYQYFNEYPGINQPRIPAVARAKISEVVAAARAGTVSEWYKYNKNLGGWTQNGLTGEGTNILPGTDRYDMHTDAVYSPALGKYLLVAWEQTGWDYSDSRFPIYPSHRGYYLYTSTDGVNWQNKQKLYTPQLANEENPYPFFAGGLEHAQTRDDFNVIGGNQFYLFFPDRINHKFYRVPINIE